jgi:cell division protein FtsI (penicillin-binding protein 3)
MSRAPSSTERKYGAARLARAADTRHLPHADKARDGVRVLARARTRLVVAGLVFGTACTAVGARLLELGLANPGLPAVAVRAIEEAEAPARRADITDRNGVLLATTVTVPSVYADPALILDPRETAEALARQFPELDAAELERRFSEPERRFVWIKRRITPQEQEEILSLGLPGILFRDEARRLYPQGPLTAHILGTTDVDGHGVAGLELGLERRLISDQEPVPLSIDITAQYMLRRELSVAMERHSAMAANGLVMDVHTGEIVAMVSLPDYDPADPSTINDTNRFNRNTLGVYEMGSVFKIFNTAAALDSGAVGLYDRFDVGNPIRVGRYTINDFHPERGSLDVATIFAHSSNIGSVHIALELGTERQRDYLSRLGLTGPVSLELPERGAPMTPRPWREINTMTISYGHGIAVTPVQLCAAVASVIGGGTRVAPTLLHGDTPPGPGERIFSPQTSDTMRRLMRMVVVSGTGELANVPGYVVGGKTGTADKPSRRGYDEHRLISSYAGVFPMNDPKYVIFAMLDEPRPTRETYGYATGGWVAAPVFARVVEGLAPLYGILPVDEADPEVAARMALPPAPSTAAGGGHVASN